jgi:hypothetical protein
MTGAGVARPISARSASGRPEAPERFGAAVDRGRDAAELLDRCDDVGAAAEPGERRQRRVGEAVGLLDVVTGERHARSFEVDDCADPVVAEPGPARPGRRAVHGAIEVAGIR